jgi:hypothetical protein
MRRNACIILFLLLREVSWKLIYSARMAPTAHLFASEPRIVKQSVIGTALIIVFSMSHVSALWAQQPLQIFGTAPQFQPERYAHLHLSASQLEAVQELELAQYRFVTWTHFEFPTQLRDIDNRLAIAQAEQQSLERRVKEFSRYTMPLNDANPLLEDLENRKLALVAAQRSTDQLQYERGLMLQHQSLEYRIRWQEVERARLKLRTVK